VVQDAEQRGIPGAIVEAGVALGGSAIILASAKSKDRPLHLYDVFGTIPPPSDRDGEDVQKRYQTIISGRSKGIAGGQYYGYRQDLEQAVARNLERFGFDLDRERIRLIPGPFQDTLNPPAVAVAHVDADWYSSVKVCLERIWPKLSPGGTVVIDDYDVWSGCRTAVDEWRSQRTDVTLTRHARIHLNKAT
jgi:asparagine synthase (glutamine-hydrolysing)